MRTVEERAAAYAELDSVGDELMNLSERTQKILWALHKRLGESYDAHHGQMKDAIAMGKLAQAVDAMREARGLVRESVIKF